MKRSEKIVYCAKIRNAGIKAGRGRRMYAARILILAGLGLAVLNCGSKNPTEPKTFPKPNITVAPAVSDITDATATVTWETDIESSTVVKYGFLSGQLIFNDSSYVTQTQHSALLSGLRSNTNYYYKVQSTSKGGTVSSEELTFKTGLGLADLAPAGWAEYEKGQIRNAIAYFKALYAKLPTSPDALNGLGWCYADASVDSMSQALAYFSKAIQQKLNFSDAMVGLGFVNLALKKYGPCIENLAKVLTLNPNYTFSHNSKVDSKDLRLGLAEAYFYIQDFPSAQTQVTVLAPANGLNPADSATWLVDGKNYGSYAEALLAYIEKLKS